MEGQLSWTFFRGTDSPYPIEAHLLTPLSTLLSSTLRTIITPVQSHVSNVHDASSLDPRTTLTSTRTRPHLHSRQRL